VIDEAQNLDTDASSSSASSTIRCTAGSRCSSSGITPVRHGCGPHAQLSDRVARWVQFEPLDGRNLHSTLDSYHPYFEATEPAVLDRVNAEYTKGVFRRWAMVLKEGIALSAAHKTPGMLTAGLVPPLLRSLGEKAVN